MKKEELKTQDKFYVYIDGELDHEANSKTEAIWNLGAKFGGNVYNKLYDEKRIVYHGNSVDVRTK